MSNIVLSNNRVDMFESMEKAYKFAEIIAKSDIIPEHYRGKSANTFIAIQTAYRMNLDPMHVMQNTFVIKGKLGMNSTFAISLANGSGLFKGGIRYKIENLGEDLEGNLEYYEGNVKKAKKEQFSNIKVTAWTQLNSTGEEISYAIGMREAIAEGWTQKSGSKYKTLPELMLRYRAATLLIRTHAPEVLNGMHMVEEIEDVASAARDVTPTAQQKEEIKEKAERNKNLAEQLITMCKDAGLEVKEFAKFAKVDSTKPETVENAIENFSSLKDAYLEAHNEAA